MIRACFSVHGANITKHHQLPLARTNVIKSLSGGVAGPSISINVPNIYVNLDIQFIKDQRSGFGYAGHAQIMVLENDIIRAFLTIGRCDRGMGPKMRQ